MDYCPHTPADIQEMQAAIGIKRIEELFADIPQRYIGFLKRSMGFGETHLIRGVGVGGGGAVGVPDQYLQKAEELAKSIVKSV